MSYNGVGLQTARGSATNGYVSRNLSHVKVNKSWKVGGPVAAASSLPFKPAMAQKANEELLLHERKRKVELQVLLFEEKLRDTPAGAAMEEDEIQEQVDGVRVKLLKELEAGNVSTSTSTGNKGTHELAAMKAAEDVRLRAAFGISPSFVPGQSFKAIGRTPEEKEAARLERVAAKDAEARARGEYVPESSKQAPRMPSKFLDREPRKREEDSDEEEQRKKKSKRSRRHSRSRSRSRSSSRSNSRSRSKSPGAASAAPTPSAADLKKPLRGSGYDRFTQERVRREERSAARVSDRAANAAANRAGLQRDNGGERWRADDRRDRRDSRSRSRSRDRDQRRSTRDADRTSDGQPQRKAASAAPGVSEEQKEGIASTSVAAPSVPAARSDRRASRSPSRSRSRSPGAKRSSRADSRSRSRSRSSNNSRSSRSRSRSSGSSRSGSSRSRSRSRSDSRSPSPKRKDKNVSSSKKVSSKVDQDHRHESAATVDHAVEIEHSKASQNSLFLDVRNIFINCEHNFKTLQFCSDCDRASSLELATEDLAISSASEHEELEVKVNTFLIIE